MAFLKFTHEQINYCQPSVVMILNWFRREFNADIEVHETKKLGGCIYRVTGDGLPDKKLSVLCTEVVPGVVSIKIGYAR